MERDLYIDGFNICIAQNAVSNISNSSGESIGMYLTTLNMIRTFVDRFKPTKVFFVLDGPNAGERRRKLYPNYKNKKRVSNRSSPVSIMDEDGGYTQHEDEGGFFKQLGLLYEFLKLLPVTVLAIPYCEADDMISYLVLKNKDERENIIISNDRDYLQLVQAHVLVYRWRTKKLYDEAELIREFKIKPSHFIFRKILLGDDSDAIGGIKGIGKQTFDGLAPIFLNESNTFENVGDVIDYFEKLDISGFSKREQTAIKKIIAGKNEMLLFYQLMKLDEDCMKLNQRETLRVQIDEQIDKGLSRMACKIQMQKSEFNRLYLGFHDDRWIQPFAFLKQGINTKA